LGTPKPAMLSPARGQTRLQRESGVNQASPRPMLQVVAAAVTITNRRGIVRFDDCLGLDAHYLPL
jgi:hypothetical protein